MADVWKETFVNKGTNAQISATENTAIQARVNAEKHDDLPHNSFVLSNTNATATLFIFLDDFSDQDSPDYILFPNQTIAVGIDDGVSFTTMFLKNTHATTDILVNEIKFRIATLKRQTLLSRTKRQVI
tara:strand:+ start:88 stop:471 length:384 start_codon:yes stop_codon:yes gene_type:complete